jgi:hypothetical protein
MRILPCRFAGVVCVREGATLAELRAAAAAREGGGSGAGAPAQ